MKELGKYPVLCAMLLWATACGAQTIADTLTSDFHVLKERNFSRNSSVSLSWETKGAHDYTFKAGDRLLDESRKRSLHTLRAAAALTIMRQGRFSLYGNLQYTGYFFDCSSPSYIFQEDHYNMYRGGLTASYFTSLLGRPLFLAADVTADGWDKGFGLVQGRMAAVMILTQHRDMRFSVGLAGMTVRKVPVVPVLTYWQRLANPNWSVDVTLPSHLFLRYQSHRQRLSIGGQMAVDNFYLRTNVDDVPKNCRYSEVAVKPEVLYEYIIGKHLYVSAQAGLSVPIRGALYTKSGRDIELSGEDLRQHRSTVPFLQVGLTYSLK